MSGGGNEVYIFRQAVKNSNTPLEIFKNSPFVETMAGIKTKIRAFGNADQISQDHTDPPQAPATGGSGGTATDAVDADAESVDPELKQELDDAAHRICRKLLAYVEEHTSLTATRDLLQGTPLATIQPSIDSGNVLVIFDANAFGETDSRPELRQCPFPRDRMENWV